MSKYNAKKTMVDGLVFDSKREAARWCELKLLERGGEITDLRRQVRYRLIPSQDGERPCDYVADFVYTEKGREVVEDVKGHKTPEYVIKRKLLQHTYGIKIKEVK